MKHKDGFYYLPEVSDTAFVYSGVRNAQKVLLLIFSGSEVERIVNNKYYEINYRELHELSEEFLNTFKHEVVQKFIFNEKLKLL